MVTFCTFGVVQSFGVYQDYYTVRTSPPRHRFAIVLTLFSELR